MMQVPVVEDHLTVSHSQSEPAPWHCAIIIENIDDNSLGWLSRWSDVHVAPETNGWTVALGESRFNQSSRILRSNLDEAFCVLGIEHLYPPAALNLELGPQWNHAAFFCDDLREVVAGLEGIGFVRDAWREDANGRLIGFAYMISPDGLRFEINENTPSVPCEEDSIHRAKRVSNLVYRAGVEADLASGMDPALAAGPVVKHISALVRDPVTLAEGLGRVMGFNWREPVKRRFTSVATGEVTECLEIASLGAPSVRLLSKLPAPLDQASGFNHVAFASPDVEAQASGLEAHGFSQIAFTEEADGSRSVILSSREGTFVMLVPER